MTYRPAANVLQAFRSSGNNEIPANLHMPSREALLLPDRITPQDNLELFPPPDADFLLSQLDDITTTPLGFKPRASNREINLQEDFSNSQFLGLADKDEDSAYANNDDLDLELDFGLDLDDHLLDRSVEMGRGGSLATPIQDDIFSELGIHPRKDNHIGDPSMDLGLGNGVRIDDGAGDIEMVDDFQFDLGDQSAMPGPSLAPDMSRARISESPLSDVREDDIRLGEAEFARQSHIDLYEPVADDEAPVARKVTQRAKKRKVLEPDAETMLSNDHIRKQQAQHDNILGSQSFLPRDPYVTALMEMQKSNALVTNIMLDDRSSQWAPELRGLLSLATIYRPVDLKRKRDSGINDMGILQGASKSPRLDIGDDDDFGMDGGHLGNHTVGADGTVLEIPGDETILGHDDARPMSVGAFSSPAPAFGDALASAVHPADNVAIPISLATKHAVHILRDLFGEEAATSAEKRKKTAVVFQQLLPENRTTKADATKMFFECLVLATKDAIKVDQAEGVVGGEIKVRGKPGLWGEWAEREAGGEIAAQMDPEPAIAAGSSAAVAVEA